MTFRKVLITGSCGLVGSEASLYFMNQGSTVLGIDNNARKKWFGINGDTSPIRTMLCGYSDYTHADIDITSGDLLQAAVKEFIPDLIIHCAGQPSHEKSAEIPREDFIANAVGTINVLEATRTVCPQSPLIFISSNKVYGDQPNNCLGGRGAIRFSLNNKYRNGFDELLSTDVGVHSPYGASKAAADIMVQEYGRYYGMKTVCFRCGCITGANHQGVEQHGFLSYLCRVAKRNETYTLYGHGGTQVRDNIHAYDLVRACDLWAQQPQSGEIYNIGGGLANSCSIIEAIQIIKDVSGIEVKTQEGPSRKGDHLCYYTDLSKFQRCYPKWTITRSLRDIITELLGEVR